MPTNRNQLGAQTIATAILLLIIVVLAAGITYIWWNTIERTGHSIFIQNISSNQEFGIKIYVQNIGKGTVVLSNILIDEEKIPVTTENCLVNNQKTITLEEGQSAVIAVNGTYEGRIHVKVVCADGTFHEMDANL